MTSLRRTTKLADQSNLRPTSGINTRLQAEITPFFFNDTATTEIYTLSLHDALPISCILHREARWLLGSSWRANAHNPDRKSTPLNSSHQIISYAVFCLKKKKNSNIDTVHWWFAFH